MNWMLISSWNASSCFFFFFWKRNLFLTSYTPRALHDVKQSTVSKGNSMTHLKDYSFSKRNCWKRFPYCLPEVTFNQYKLTLAIKGKVASSSPLLPSSCLSCRMTQVRMKVYFKFLRKKKHVNLMWQKYPPMYPISYKLIDIQNM